MEFVLIEIIDPFTEPLSEDSIRVVAVVREPPPRTWERAHQRLKSTHHRIDRLRWRSHEFVQRIVRWRVQMTYDDNPRRNSRVRQHVFLPFAQVQRRLPVEATVVRAGSGRLELTTSFEPVAGGAVQARATLRLWGSWPTLPVWVTVEPWWRSRTVATLTLRSSRRLRYPRRYFGAAHAAMREMSDLVSGSTIRA